MPQATATGFGFCTKVTRMNFLLGPIVDKGFEPLTSDTEISVLPLN